jgi:hypothetical protein
LARDGGNGFPVETENPPKAAAKRALLDRHQALRKATGCRGPGTRRRRILQGAIEAQMNVVFKLEVFII